MKVLLTRPELFNKTGIHLLRKYFEVKDHIRGPMNKEELLSQVTDVHAIILPWQTEIIDKSIIEKAKYLKTIARVGVGYENIDVECATEYGIMVTYCAVHIPTVADNAFGLILCLARRISVADAFVKSGKWPDIGTKAAFNFIGFDIHHKTLGVIGLGRLGLEIAKRAKGFDIQVLYWDIAKKDEEEKALNINRASLEELLRKSDFVVICCPLNRETYHLVDASKLEMMKPKAFIINTARGGIVDEVALYEALTKKRIAGAGLDVFEKEPIGKEYPILKCENVVLTPHTGAHTYEANENMAVTTAMEVIKALQGGKPNYLINPEVCKRNL